jgi:hypothetical protein
MNDYGPVDVEELMAAHFNRVDGKDDGSRNTSVKKDPESPSYGPRMVKLVGSQECVGRKTNNEWAVIRIACKNNRNGRQSDILHEQIHSQSKSWADVTRGGMIAQPQPVADN